MTFLSTILCLLLGACSPSPDLEWVMVDVNRNLQGDAHLIRFPDGRVVLVDVGDDSETLGKFLVGEGIDRVDEVILTHPHRDHYGGLDGLLKWVTVRSLVFNPVEASICAAERPWGCDAEHFQRVVSRYTRRGIPARSVQAGDRLYDREGTRLEVVYAHDGKSNPVGPTDVNDTSLILALSHQGTRVLLTGDLNERLGAYLSENHREAIRADLIKVPHHGGVGIAPVEFFEAVGAKAALVPAPGWLWKTPNTQRVREFFGRKRTPVYVNCLHGHVRVFLSKGAYRIETERPHGPWFAGL